MNDASALAVELRGIEKAFDANLANADIHLRVKRGHIHAIVGENGAGKTTAMKILYGLIPPDAGRILIDGIERVWASPQDSMRRGLGMVQQHFMLADSESALDNVIFGHEPRNRWGFIDRERARRDAVALSEAHHVKLDWDAPVSRLSVAERQWLEILKLLFRRARVLILDEPTAVLTPLETAGLFKNLRELAAGGCSVLIITHKLKEVMELADEVTVFRQGRVVGHSAVKDTDARRLAEQMIGRRLTVLSAPTALVRDTEPLLKVRKLNVGRAGAPGLSDLSLEIRPGEIVGLAGVQGNGQSELTEALLRGVPRGARCEEWRVPRRADIAYIADDRHRDGLLLGDSALKNFALGLWSSSEFTGGGVMRWNKLKDGLRRAVKVFDVRGAVGDEPISRLSGGNQQKIILARELARRPKLIVAAEPTRGVDLGAQNFIYEKLFEARAAGAALLVVSSDLDEIMTLSDRVLVMFKGAFIAEFKRGECDDKSLGAAMGGIGSRL